MELVIPSSSSPDFHHRFKAMGSPCEIIFRGNNLKTFSVVADELVNEIQRLEKKYSRFLPDSLLTKINKSAGSGNAIAIDEETGKLLDYAGTCFEQSDGLFDITSGSLRAIWNYQDLSDKQVLPTDQQIQRALEKIGWEKVKRKENTIALPIAGMEIDFGGIVKEYAADCVANLAEASGIESGMVELGGDIRLFGVKPQQLPWQIGIRDPFNTEKPHAFIALPQGALATSGDYERYTIIQGKKYSHILNPMTGWPIEGFSSVSVIAEQCVIAGTVASIAVLRGEKGESWLQDLGLPYLCISQAGQTTGTIEKSS